MDKWCTFCGRPGHSAHQCDWPRDIPPTTEPPKEPIVIPIEEDENWMDYYGGY